ncbi:hypothetical protein L7F22_042190 [Adiantum nelumboides]|nr:hypothetical protein [Adiantum nelumboides]
MTKDGKGDPSNTNGRSSNKGKERSAEDVPAGESRAGSSLLRSVVESARTSITPQSLASTMSSGGKGVSNGGVVFNDGSMQRVKDLGGASLSGSSSTSTQGTAYQNGNSIRSAPIRMDGTDAYNQFSSGDQEVNLANRLGSSLQLGNNQQMTQPSTSAYVGPYDTASHLDRPFHQHVRTTSTSMTNNLEEAWNDANSQQYPERVYDPVYHDAWASTIPAPMFPSRWDAGQRGEAFHDLQQRVNGERESSSVPAEQLDFMDTLAIEEEQEQRVHLNNIPSALPQTWRPPSPSQRPMLTQEQYELHRRLAEQQDSKEGQRADERIRPPDDDEQARSGVYAATPEDALRAIWDGNAEGERASQHVRDVNEIRTTDAANVVRKIRRLLKRGSYADDVYGLPPALVETLAQAEEPETDANRDLRAKAIARLGALYNHLEGAEPQNVDKIVRNW